MSTQLTDLPASADQVVRFSLNRSEPKWFTDMRVKALTLAAELPLPRPEKTRIEDWNFTDFTFELNGRQAASRNELPDAVRKLIGEEQKKGTVLVHHNGVPVFARPSSHLSDRGVVFTDLLTASREHGDLLRKYYFREGKIDKHRLTALNGALVNGGTFLYVPANVQLDEPFQTVYYQDAPSSGLVAHTIVVAERGSSLTFVESYLSDRAVGESVANVLSEVYVGEGARVNFGAVDHFSDRMITYVGRQARVERDGMLQWALGQMNDGNTVSENVTELEGDGSSADIKAVSVGGGVQQQNFDNYVRHVGKATNSRLLVRGVQKDASRSIFNATTKIEHGASGADGEQTQRVLMLSEKARGDANPILLIDEYDVIAGHAASAGRVDPDQLYYLMSRGIRKEIAEKLIVEGFLEPVVDLLSVEGVRAQLAELIERKVGR